jgi:hypothetical protein
MFARRNAVNGFFSPKIVVTAGRIESNETMSYFRIMISIFDKYTDVRDIAFICFTEYHAYLWGNKIEFITQYEQENKIVVWSD